MEVGHIKGEVIIGNNVWFETNIFINQGITIGSNVVIGANSVVTRDELSKSILVGAPTKNIINRVISSDTEKFN